MPRIDRALRIQAGEEVGKEFMRHSEGHLALKHAHQYLPCLVHRAPEFLAPERSQTLPMIHQQGLGSARDKWCSVVPRPHQDGG